MPSFVFYLFFYFIFVLNNRIAYFLHSNFCAWKKFFFTNSVYLDIPLDNEALFKPLELESEVQPLKFLSSKKL